MNPLQRALISKAGYDFGFENVAEDSDAALVLASARHPAIMKIYIEDTDFIARLANGSPLLLAELTRSFPAANGLFRCHSIDALAQLLRRAAQLAHSLPSQAQQQYDATLTAELEKLPDSLKGTEVERLVRQRIGQDKFRDAMMEYWGGACAVTGIAIPEVLRASHAKPWADCTSDAERLDVFNGFLLCANLDALFDRFLVSFDPAGELLVSSVISTADRERLGLHADLRLRWIAPEHGTYLQYHFGKFSKKG